MLVIKMLVQDVLVGGLCVCALMLVVGFVVNRVSVQAGFVVLVAVLVGLGMIAAVTVVHAQHSLARQAVKSDCRITGGCTPDVIQEWCAPSPSACPSAVQVEANWHPTSAQQSR